MLANLRLVPALSSRYAPPAMHSFPAPALALVEQMVSAAAEDPERAVAFQGAPGANSHRAALEWAPGCLPLPCFSFEDAIDAVKAGRAGCAIIPIENSQHGRVADIHFLLPESGLAIVGEHFLPIRYGLMSRDLGPVTRAMSHEQALGQCRHWLRANNIAPVAHSDTAGAAAWVADSDEVGLAALAPPHAAELYGLTLHGTGMEDADHNTTRFVILAREPLADVAAITGPVMTTFMFEVKNIPAALYKALGGFATNGVNMTKLESYQTGDSFAATQFYCDIVGAPGDERIDRALEELDFQTKSLRLLGTYPQARERR